MMLRFFGDAAMMLRFFGDAGVAAMLLRCCCDVASII
jgi:hypothetical protein